MAFRAIRNIGLGLSLGLTALAAYQGVRNAMDTQNLPPGGFRQLDATAGREVVYCHACQNEWYRDEHGIVCPRCESEATEIVITPRSPSSFSNTDLALQISPENDPRPLPVERPSNEDLRALHNHNPWEGNQSDPEEDDIEPYATFRPTNRLSPLGARRDGFPEARHPAEPHQELPDIMGEFQRMVSQMIGPGVQQGPAGRSGPESLFGNFPPSPDHAAWPRQNSNFQSSTFNSGNVRGTHFTWTIGGGNGLRDHNGPGQGAPVDDINRSDSISSISRPPPDYVVNAYVIRGSADDFRSLLATLLSTMAPAAAHGHGEAGSMPPGLAGLLASFGNPANAVSGDAVYSQEALDRIISGLMEQTSSSNAPGPAPASAIAALPKKAVDEKMLGAEGKAECSVCMDDVTLGDEVVVLPCTHWFHEACASAWLSEHNTCPICRTGLSEDGSASAAPGAQRPRSANNQAQSMRPGGTGPERRRSFMQNMRDTQQRHSERLERIRNAGAVGGNWASNSTAPEVEERPRRRYQIVGDGDMGRNGAMPPMPGAFESHRGSSASSQGYETPSRRSSGSTGSQNQGGPLGWLRRFGSGNGGSGNGSGSGSGR